MERETQILIARAAARAYADGQRAEQKRSKKMELTNRLMAFIPGATLVAAIAYAVAHWGPAVLLAMVAQAVR